MAKGYLVVLTNPVSPEREEEFNHWYNEIHASEVVALPGFTRMTRLRAGPAIAGTSDYAYLALYECDDLELAHRTILERRDGLNVSEALDASAVAVFFEPIFSFPSNDAG